MKYRKKPVVVDAWRAGRLIQAAKYNWAHLPTVIAEAYDNGEVVFGTQALGIKTLEGEMRAEFDDWVIRGTEGELYPCKPAAFDATFEPMP